ncbi:DUF4145 domain-containing protein [Enterobacter sp. JMULE2]|uniref:DUF4145 domain-containing protein n=1 Tax=Enterobacter sp. JMULE2 TaxID=2518340 RepID=UPI00157760D0|nr:DUF4145 domain-containing protein [Enterobacter sp. JMULE2]
MLQPLQTVTVSSVVSTSSVSAYSTAMCPECHGPVLISYRFQIRELANVKQAFKNSEWVLTNIDMSDLKVFPEIKEPDDSPHYPEKIRKIFVELQEDIQMKRSAPRIVVGCRSVLEVALQNLGYEKGNLLSRINQARTDGHLTEAMKHWAHRVRLDGNEAAHELEASDSEASELVSFIRLFLEISFVLPHRVSDAQNAAK